MDRSAARIADSLRENLSGLRATDEACMEIRARTTGRQAARPMRSVRPVRVALAFALALTLLAATAVAAVTAWREFAMRAQRMEEETGPFASWTIEDKKATVAQLAEAGLLDGDERAQRLLHGEIAQDEAHALADAIVAQTLGGRRTDDVGVLELTQAVFGGPFEAWGYEDKAWWQSVTDAAGSSGDYFRYTLPREGELGYDEALALARETAMREFGLDAEALDALDVACDFIGFDFDEEMRVWRFTFGNAAGTGKGGFLVWLRADTGEIRNVESW